MISYFLPLIFCRYVAPEYASSGMLNERSDVYSFGVLLMEIITGRTPIDYSRPPAEVIQGFVLVFICAFFSKQHHNMKSYLYMFLLMCLR